MNKDEIVPIVLGLIAAGGALLDQIGSFRGMSMINLGNRKVKLDQMDQALAAIQEADPNFNLDEFCHAAVNAFLELEQAFDQQDLSDIRAFVSDGIYQRMTFRLEEWQSLGRSRKTTNVEINSIGLVEISSSQNNTNAFEVISVAIEGSAVREYRASQGTSQNVTEETEAISEVWTFLRRRGAKTKSKDFGSIHGKCPNCGADVSVNQWEKCPACDSLVRSGEHDWVLSEISDRDRWKATTPLKLSSAARYWITQDPGFSTHYLEDRASVIFYRKFLADRLGVVDPLGKVATDRFCDAYEKKLQPDQSGQRVVYLEPHILAADVTGVIVEEPFDQALMHVRWTALRGKVGSGEQIPRQPERVQMSTMLVLVRQHGAKTRIERTITSSHCPKCGAPESNSATHSCEFCNTILNNGEFEWALADMLPHSSTAALAYRKKAYEGIETNVTVMTSQFDEDTSLKRIVAIEQNIPAFTKSDVEGVRIDGAAPDVMVREDDVTLCLLLRDIYPSLAVSKDQIKQFILGVAAELQIDKATLRAALSRREKFDRRRVHDLPPMLIKRWLSALIDASLVDATLELWERGLILAAAKEIRLSRYDVDAAIRARLLTVEEWTDTMRSVDMFSWVVAIAAADGKFDKAEVKQLEELARQYNIAPERFREMCQAARNDTLDMATPQDGKAGKIWLIKMIDMALADGKLSSAERKLLIKIAKKIDFTQYDLQQLIRRRQSVLYQRAQEALKDKRPKSGDPLHVQADWND